MLSVKLLIYIEALQILAFALFRASLKDEARRLIRPLDLAVVMMIPVVGLFGHNKSVFYGFMAIVPLLSIGKPAELVRRYLLVLPLFPALLENYTINGLYFGTISAVDALNLGGLTALLFTSRSRAKSVLAIDCAVWVLFVVCLLMETRGMPLGGTLRSTFLTLLSIAPPFYLVARLVSTRQIAADATLFMVLGAFCNAVVAAFESVRHWPLYQGFYDSLNVEMGLSATLYVRAGFLRAQGPMASATGLGLILALGVIAAFAMRTRFRFPGWAMILALLGIGAVSSQSRGAWLAMAVGLALYLLYERRTALLIALVSMSMVAGIAVATFAPQNSRIAGLIGRSGHGEQTADYRKRLFSRGLQEVAAHPLVGQTRQRLEVSMNDMRQGEHIIDYVNTPLNVALTSGLTGLALYFIAWLVPLFAGWAWRGGRNAHDVEAPIALPFAMIGACMTCLLFTSAIDRMLPLSMVSMGLMSAYLRLAQTDRSKGRVGPAASRRRLVARVPRPGDGVRQPARL